MEYPLSPQVALIANGEIISYPETKKLLSSYKKIIAVDGGANHCEKMGIVPDLIVGDLDSASSKMLEKYADIPILKYPVEKDESDLELAIQKMIEQGVDSMGLFAVLGKRVDHLLYTLHLLARYPEKLIICSESQTIFCLQKQNRVLAKKGQTISLIPLSPVSGISTQGLEWELKNAFFDKNWMSLSNVCLSDFFTVEVESGDLLCCLQNLQ